MPNSHETKEEKKLPKRAVQREKKREENFTRIVISMLQRKIKLDTGEDRMN